MHLHAWYLERFVQENDQAYQGAVLIDCLSLNKGELIFHWKLADDSFFNWKLQWDASTFFLSFPAEIHRNSRGSLNQFKSLHGKALQGIQSVENDRTLILQFEQEWKLIIKAHGRNANVIAYQHEEWKEMFRQNLNNDAHSSLDSHIQAAEPTLLFNQKLPENWRDIRNDYLKGEIFLVPKKERYDLLPESEHPISVYSNMIEAWNAFTPLFLKSFHFHNKQQSLIQARKAGLKKIQKRLKGLKEKKRKVEGQKTYRQFGDLIFSHFHAVRKGMTRINLEDYTTGQQVEVPLLKELSPQQNADRYYKKAKNQHLELEHLEKRHQELLEEQKLLEKEIETLSRASGFTDLKSLDKKDHQEKQQAERLPYHQYSYQGYVIWVGKTAQDNDLISLKLAKKDDLWLHARDVPGSHVIVKHRSGQNYPQNVIEYAAELAAGYSKLGKDSLCPVIYTPKKFIRKRKGAAAGEVVVDKEEVILVTPNRH